MITRRDHGISTTVVSMGDSSTPLDRLLSLQGFLRDWVTCFDFPSFHPTWRSSSLDCFAIDLFLSFYQFIIQVENEVRRLRLSYLQIFEENKRHRIKVNQWITSANTCFEDNLSLNDVVSRTTTKWPNKYKGKKILFFFEDHMQSISNDSDRDVKSWEILFRFKTFVKRKNNSYSMPAPDFFWLKSRREEISVLSHLLKSIWRVSLWSCFPISHPRDIRLTSWFHLAFEAF